MIPTLFRIDERNDEFEGTFTLRLCAPTGNRPAAFSPGQFNMLYAFGTGEVPISMSGSLDDDDAYVHTIRCQGLATRTIERLNKGDVIGVRGPFGRGWPLDTIAGKEVLIIAGGLGLAPLRPVIYQLLNGHHGARRVRLFYGARRPRELLYYREFERWADAIDITVTVDHADHVDRAWKGRVGVITEPLEAARISSAGTIAFLCGPEVMMRFCIHTLLKKGLPESAIYLSMERNMKCATGLCGHCQWGPNFVCKDGPVFCYGSVRSWFNLRAL
ncbi:FAD/NAD(P)-binding protein [Microbulbifer harenosus]|uniref:Ni/Fe hydrogenase subunit gamma n=1 Tax=Microbulbifer harenosus TaxID=2576840 RepID=A0ABY2UI54_9GAMM|nr:FAD/NAD(P)-binding protein [Microbulbifer harenosus]TLM76439.1 Ni/Fe hydrogenase subunit gamma [Microbulbifer harenosus]